MTDDNNPAPIAEATWFLYLLECEGDTIYTGITTDVERRYAQHVAGTGAKYTRARKPIRLLGWLQFPSKSEALKAEIRTKRMTAAQKRAMCVDLQPRTGSESSAQ